MDQLSAALAVILATDTSTIDSSTPEGQLLSMRVNAAKEFARKAAGHGRIKALRDAEKDPEMIAAYDRVLEHGAKDLEDSANRLLQIVSSQSLSVPSALQ